jgi:hypothetical protein
MNNTALITGASSGIGLELAKIHASKGGNLVLVARNSEKLNELKSELEKNYSVTVHIIAKDLSNIASSLEVFNEVKDLNIHIDYLINNAGFGDFGLFAESNWEKQLQMINLNITALTYLTRLFLPEMKEKGSGKILNLASIASFQPGPTMSVYFATKAYVLSFSEAIANELKNTGVTVTALCPGATKSGFQSAAALDDSSFFSNNKLPTAQVVAEFGYKKMMAGKTVVIHGFMNSLIAFSVRFLPRKLVAKATRMMMETKN